jgi:hypothetical protein
MRRVPDVAAKLRRYRPAAAGCALPRTAHVAACHGAPPLSAHQVSPLSSRGQEIGEALKVMRTRIGAA